MMATPPPLKRLKEVQEQEEDKKKEQDEAHLYTIIKVARDKDLREQIGKDLYFDLVDHDKVHSFRIENQLPFTVFKEEVAKEFGIPVRFQRYWFWAKRQNHTYRPNRPLTALEELQTVSTLREVPNKVCNAELKLFLEVELGVDSGFTKRLSPPGKSREDILIFFKLYNPEKEDLSYVGRMFVKEVAKPIDIIAKLNELAGFPDNEEIELYEEIKFEPDIMCEPIDKRINFRNSQLGDGDIICFQKAIRYQSETHYRYPDVPSYLEHVHKRQMRLKKEQEEKEYKKKEKDEARLYTIIKVARDEDLNEQIGKDIYFDLVDYDKVHSFRVQKQLQFTSFKEEVAKEFGIPVRFQRYWFWAKPQNHTYRPNRPLTAREELQTVGTLRKVLKKAHKVELELFLEVEIGGDSEFTRRLSPLGKSTDDILIFFKLYNPEKEDLRYVGRMLVKEIEKPIEIIAKLNELAGFPDNEEIELYKEIQFDPNIMCEPIDKRISFRSSKLGDGDIICFQRAIISESEVNYRYPDIPSFFEHIHNRQMKLKKEKEEEEYKKEKAKAHLYTIIRVARDEDLRKQIGKYIYFDLVDHNKVRSFRVQKQLPFTAFKEKVAKKFGIPVQFQRYWLWAKRPNHTYRPNRPLTSYEELQTVGTLREVSNKAHNAELKLLLEVELGVDLSPLPPPDKTREDILIYFKLYDPEKEQLRYVGRMFVKAVGKPIEIIAKLNELAGFPDNEELELYEEIKFEPTIMCEPVDKRISFKNSQLEDGDIICYQKAIVVDRKTNYRYPDVPTFLKKYVHNRQVVHFRLLEKPKEDDFSLELSKVHTYDDVVERVASHIGLDDPSKIRLTSHNCYSQQPKPQPIRYRGVELLSDMLVHYSQTSDILYYEVLDIPLPELQGLKTLKVVFHHSSKDEVVSHSIRLPKNSTVGDLINDLKSKVELSRPDAELRLLEVFYHKIYKIIPTFEKIENINDQYWTLRAEEIPEEESNLGTWDRLIHVYHFMKDPNQNQVQNFGEPFLLVIHEGETLAEVKTRIQKKLQIPDEEFAKWKFAFLSMNRPEYLKDIDVVSSRFQRRYVYGSWEQYLGLEHADTTL